MSLTVPAAKAATPAQMKHERDVIRFFVNHPKQAATPAGQRVLWRLIQRVTVQLRSLQAVKAARTPPAWWLEQAACVRSHEGAWTSNTGNGFYGAYQFMLSTWQAVGGAGYPHEASPEEQTYRAWLLWSRSGWGPWPTTSRMCGLR